ncbi:TraH family protein [Rhizobium ruizarguesonis]|uniref:TraH family protein n=1 Tax=Rhizobium ruizarguesonis TaxID=2081791 RepID=UPI00102FA1C1|nr:TraH family protein [Rhizobium ruizarguesonis]TBD95203.1 conjugal transfer protein TraH [Rhizobium ruizarguesonis]TBE62903.1 conjugal transfer protein TraH [Rhizobium ruizarguesonis]
MLDATMIQKCADPSLTPAIVEQFVQRAGSSDPLAVTVKAGGRLILVPKAKTPDEAMELIRQYVGQAVVRVGITQVPAGVGVKDVSELKSDLVHACENLRLGTGMFAKVVRIVAKWYGNPTDRQVFPQIFEDAVYAWKTGEFEGVSVFRAEDPGVSVKMIVPPVVEQDLDTDTDTAPASSTLKESENSGRVGAAEMRIDLSRIGAK